MLHQPSDPASNASSGCGVNSKWLQEAECRRIPSLRPSCQAPQDAVAPPRMGLSRMFAVVTAAAAPSAATGKNTPCRRRHNKFPQRDAGCDFRRWRLKPGPHGSAWHWQREEAPLTKYNECWWGNEQRQMMANVSRLSRRIFKSWEYARGRGGSWGGSCG